MTAVPYYTHVCPACDFTFETTNPNDLYCSSCHCEGCGAAPDEICTCVEIHDEFGNIKLVPREAVE